MSSENPYVQVLARKVRNLRKKLEKIASLEQSFAAGKVLDNEQLITISSKDSVEKAMADMVALRDALAVVAKEQETKEKEEAPVEKAIIETQTEIPPSADMSTQSDKVKAGNKATQCENAAEATATEFSSTSFDPKQYRSMLDEQLKKLLKALHVYLRYSDVTAQSLPTNIDFFGKSLLGQTSISGFAHTLQQSLRAAGYYVNDDLAVQFEAIRGVKYSDIAVTIDQLADEMEKHRIATPSTSLPTFRKGSAPPAVSEAAVENVADDTPKEEDVRGSAIKEEMISNRPTTARKPAEKKTADRKLNKNRPSQEVSSSVEFAGVADVGNGSGSISGMKGGDGDNNDNSNSSNSNSSSSSSNSDKEKSDGIEKQPSKPPKQKKDWKKGSKKNAQSDAKTDSEDAPASARNPNPMKKTGKPAPLAQDDGATPAAAPSSSASKKEGGGKQRRDRGARDKTEKIEKADSEKATPATEAAATKEKADIPPSRSKKPLSFKEKLTGIEETLPPAPPAKQKNEKRQSRGPKPSKAGGGDGEKKPFVKKDGDKPAKKSSEKATPKDRKNDGPHEAKGGADKANGPHVASKPNNGYKKAAGKPPATN